MLYNILKQCTPAELAAMEDADLPDDVKSKLATKPEEELKKDEQKLKRRLVLKNKI